MKNLSIFFGCLFFLLTSCSLKNSKKFSEDQFIALWQPIISLLMQDPGLATHWSHQDVNIDLLEIERKNFTQLEFLWQKIPKPNATKKEMIKQENQFFHEELEKLNEKVIYQLARSAHSSSEKKDYWSIANAVINTIETHPLSSSKNIFAQPDGDQIGFCFARALLTHYLLLKSGVPQHDISKIFVVGKMKVSEQFWHFHVAIMVRDANFGFMVVDPAQNQPYGYIEWMDINRRYSIKYPFSRLRFFVTDPRKFLPASGMYDLASLSMPIFQKYFYELAQAMGDNLGHVAKN